MFRRSLHTVPKLAKDFSQSGIKGLMSPAQFQLAWNDHQTYLTSQLSLKTVDTELETRSPLSIALSCSKDTLKADVGSIASMAHNNHMFFEQMKDEDNVDPQSIIKPQLLKAINSNFGSLEDLRGNLLYSADILYGNGWIFLVEDANKQLRITTCNNSGTPYYYGQSQSVDLNGPLDETDLNSVNKNKERAVSGEKDYSIPLLVLNVWQHAYILDYGSTGKADYLENLWKCIDWNVINKRLFTNIDM